MLTELRKFIRLLIAFYQNKEVDFFYWFFYVTSFFTDFSNEISSMAIMQLDKGLICVARQIKPLLANKQNTA